MEAGVHLPQLELAGDGLSYRRLADTVDAARECGFVAISANDHFFFGAPWLDGLTTLAASLERAGSMILATTVSLPTLRGPVHWPSAAHAARPEPGPDDRRPRARLVKAGLRRHRRPLRGEMAAL